MEVCRACRSSKNKMFPLDSNFIKHYNILTNLNVTEHDGLPQQLCKNCMDTVLAFIEFQQQCTHAETALREDLLQTMKTEEKVQAAVLGQFKIECDDQMYVDYEELNCNYSDLDEDFIKMEPDDIKPRRSKRVKSKPKKIGFIDMKKKYKENKIKEENSLLADFSCGICSESFMEQSNVVTHLEKHKNDKHCGKCPELFKDWPQLLAHRFNHIPEKQRWCTVCNKKFLSSINFEFHYRKHHTNEEAKAYCRKCDKSFIRTKSLYSHLRLNHSSNVYICDICKKEFQQKTSLRVHLNTHSVEKKYMCEFCSYTSKNNSNLYAHKLAKHLETNKCEKCKKKFKDQSNFDKHKCESKSRVCPKCGLLINSKSYLSHVRSHKESSEYKCKICPAAYRSKAGLKVHMDRHEGNKTQQCNYCPMKFYCASVLIKHRRIHTGVRPYVCEICEKRFTGKHNLKVHMKVHGLHIINKKNTEEHLVSHFTTIETSSMQNKNELKNDKR